MTVIADLKNWARSLKRDVFALYFAARDPETPRAAKLVAGLVAAYALSPIDLIPDFIPVLGYLNDLILVPLGIALALRMVPAEIVERARVKATAMSEKPMSRAGLLMVVALWIAFAVLCWLWLSRRRHGV